MKPLLLVFIFACTSPLLPAQQENFRVKGFHLDLRIQVMTMPALKNFALKLKQAGMNTLVMEWEGTYPFEKHPLIPNRYAYTKKDIASFISYCKTLGIDVIPLQQSFGHVEYILRHYRYRQLREDQKDYSQVCPLETEGNRKLFTELFSEMAATHPSKYFHIGGDETYLLGHCPKCSRKAALEGVSKLYIDHIRMLCEIVIGLGKRPVLWADIALKYPDAIHLLPKETIFIDWNYGWDINRFGDHQKLMDSGYEIWGAPSLRSHPDNYFLTQWKKHFQNISDFIPAARGFGYKGMIMTSWSTSGQYTAVNETDSDIIDLYAIRHVYPITGFNILLSAYSKALNEREPLNIKRFIQNYCKETYGLNEEQSSDFNNALFSAPYEIVQGKVMANDSMTLQQLLDTAKQAFHLLTRIHPLKNKNEFDQYRLMADIRVQYLSFELIESYVNSEAFKKNNTPHVLAQLRSLISRGQSISNRFTHLNQGYFNPEEIRQENELRISRIKLLYARLAGIK